MHRAHASALFFLASFVAAWLLVPRHNLAPEGQVRDAQGPVCGARIRYQGESSFALSDRRGRFRLPSPPARPRRLTAWKEGYAIAATPPVPPLVRGGQGGLPLQLLLQPLPAADNDDYAWIDAVPDPRQQANCGNCHEHIYRDWAGSAHARAASNRRLHNLMAGRDWHDRPSPRWSLRHEYPQGSGVCATCHAPTFADPALDYDLTRVAGVAARGVHCDYCHKVVDAPTDRLGTRLGRDGLVLLRPPAPELLSFGPLDDSFLQGESFAFAPVYKESRFCASCHEGILFGVHVYGTYSEWLQSPARAQGQQCQDCHMAPDGQRTNIAPGHGGVERAPGTLASHRLVGSQPDMLRRCLSVTVALTPQADGLHAEVTVRADNVGHRVPTGFIDRNLVLVVEGFEAQGRPVPLLQGPTLPAHAGVEWQGKPGWLYAKQLHAEDGRTPIPFWLPSERQSDTRLWPGKPDQRTFAFAAATTRVRLRLFYRRFWPEVADAKGWPANEVLVVDRIVTLSGPAQVHRRGNQTPPMVN